MTVEAKRIKIKDLEYKKSQLDTRPPEVLRKQTEEASLYASVGHQEGAFQLLEYQI